MSDSVAPPLPSPCHTSITVVSLRSLFKFVVSKEMHYTYVNLLVVSHYVSCTSFPCSYSVNESTHEGCIWDVCWNTQTRSCMSYIKSWKMKNCMASLLELVTGTGVCVCARAQCYEVWFLRYWHMEKITPPPKKWHLAVICIVNQYCYSPPMNKTVTEKPSTV
jgi:hypothetical protein